MTLRLRLLLALVGLVAAGLLVANVVTYTSLRSYLFSQVDQQLQTAATPVARVLWACWNEEQAPYGPSCGSNGVVRIASGSIPAGTYGQLRDSNGNVLYSACLPSETEAAKSPRLPSRLPISQTVNGASVFSVAGTGCGSASYSGIAVTTNVGTASGPVDVIVGIPLTSVNQTLDRLQIVEILVSLAVLAALGALAWWIVRRGLRPLEEMATTAGAIAAGDLSRRVDDSDPQTEVGKLGSALNRMLGEIERAFAARGASEDRLRRFLADASHELRTPLTSIRGYAEMFERGTRDRPEDLATSMRHIREDAKRMSVLVDDLLLLARLDKQRPLANDEVDMTEITSRAVEAARVASPDRSISFESSGPARVTGDGDRLRQVVDNLLANSAQHTPHATPIEVRLRTDDAAVGIEVTDHGPGIPAAEHERIFEPFHRADPSRARASGGVGLGLAIVSAIVRAHGGQVGVISNGSGGATFWIRIPRGGVIAAPEVQADQATDGTSSPPLSAEPVDARSGR